jgi:hypothetical protein
MSRDAYVVKRIEKVQRELEEIKDLVSKGNGQNITLLGLWEGVDFSDEEIEEAKRSLFKGIERYESA